MIRRYSQINKSDDMPNGISRIIEYDKRVDNPKPVICFSVLVSVNGKPKTKKFRVSKGASEICAKSAAIRFRNYYEDCVNNGIEFDYEKYSNWNQIMG